MRFENRKHAALMEGLRRQISGRAVAFGEEEYDQQRTPWLQVIDQHPAVIVNTADVDDIRIAVLTVPAKASRSPCRTQANA